MQWQGFDITGKVAYGNINKAKKTNRHFNDIEQLVNFLKLTPHMPDNTDCCDACKYTELDETELPCSMCCYNAIEDGMSYYEKGEDE